jgi:hypothetical protein
MHMDFDVHLLSMDSNATRKLMNISVCLNCFEVQYITGLLPM